MTAAVVGGGARAATAAEGAETTTGRLATQRQTAAPSGPPATEQGSGVGSQPEPTPEPQPAPQPAKQSTLTKYLGPTPGGTRAGRTVDTGAGFIVGFLLWAWVGLPFLLGGPTRTRDVLRAKFFNKGPDGEWLP